MTMSPGSRISSRCSSVSSTGGPALTIRRIRRGRARLCGEAGEIRRCDHRRFAVFLHESLGDRRRAIVDGDPVAMIGQVERQVLAHDGETYNSDVRQIAGLRHRLETNPGSAWGYSRSDASKPTIGQQCTR